MKIAVNTLGKLNSVCFEIKEVKHLIKFPYIYTKLAEMEKSVVEKSYKSHLDTYA